MPDLPNGKQDEEQKSTCAQEGPVGPAQNKEPLEHATPERRTETETEKLREAVFGEAAGDLSASAKEPVTAEAEAEEEPRSVWARLRASATRGAERKKAPNRESLRQNKTSMLLGGLGLVAAMGVWLLYLVSGPIRQPPGNRAAPAGTAPAQTSAATRSITPGIEAQQQAAAPAPDKGLTAADIRATAQDHPVKPVPPSPEQAKNSGDEDRYAVGRIPPPPAEAPPPSSAPATPQKSPLDQPSLVFVRNETKLTPPVDSSNRSGLQSVSWTPAILERSERFANLPTGTRLVARLETPASSAVRLPVVAAIEYNYEDSNHELIIPAGSRALGTLEQADSQGFVGLHFTSLQLPGELNPAPFEARAIGLNFQPLKGTVTGRNTGRRFLVRAFSGFGSVAAATVGVQNGTGVTDSFSNNALLREQLMTNIGSAGDQELQRLAYQQHVVVTVPGNTRFYLVMDHTHSPEAKQENPNVSATSRVSATAPGTGFNMEEMRQLIELRRELNEIEQQSQPNSSAPVQQTIQAAPVTDGPPETGLNPSADVIPTQARPPQ